MSRRRADDRLACFAQLVKMPPRRKGGRRKVRHGRASSINPRTGMALLTRRDNARDSRPAAPAGGLLNRQKAADRALVQMGITFNVYGESAGVEKTLPFDLVPRIVASTEWDRIERGLKQRIHALNQFIDDLYHGQKIIKDKVV